MKIDGKYFDNEYEKTKVEKLDGFKIEALENILAWDIHKNSHILDIGCGEGHLYDLVKKWKMVYWGVDISKFRVAKAKKKGLLVSVMDCSDGINFPDRRFGAVFCLDIVEHIYDTEKFIRECHRILVPGGYLIVAFPNIVSLGSRIRAILGIRPSQIDYRHSDFGANHIRAFTFDDMKELCTDCGFLYRDSQGTGLFVKTSTWIVMSFKK
jgi:methionine biosynthesis protein MetW